MSNHNQLRKNAIAANNEYIPNDFILWDTSLIGKYVRLDLLDLFMLSNDPAAKPSEWRKLYRGIGINAGFYLSLAYAGKDSGNLALIVDLLKKYPK